MTFCAADRGINGSWEVLMVAESRSEKPECSKKLTPDSYLGITCRFKSVAHEWELWTQDRGLIKLQEKAKRKPGDNPTPMS